MLTSRHDLFHFCVNILQIMKIKEIVKEERSPELIDALRNVWERSVRATHTFLTEDEIVRIGNYVPDAFRSVPILVIAENDSVPSGFMGIDGNMLEMLFIDPDSRGKGTGRKLLERGISEYGVKRTTVNEQNPQAVGFYRHMGLIETDRSDTDSDGRPYPILTMELEEGI